MFDEKKEKNVIDEQCNGFACLRISKKGYQYCGLNYPTVTVCTDDIEGAFDSPQEAINYFGAIQREGLRNQKGACRDNCIYQDDCPCDWNKKVCLTVL